MKNELTKNFIVEAKIAVLRPLAFHVSANVMPLATLFAPGAHVFLIGVRCIYTDHCHQQCDEQDVYCFSSYV